MQLPKKLTNSYLSIFRDVGLNLISLETEIKALQRSLLSPKYKTSLIIDIGATNTNLIVYNNLLPQINKNIEIGGETIRKTIANSLNIDIESAEKLKNNFGLPLGNQFPHPVTKAIKFSVDNMIVQEIKHLISILKSSNQSEIDVIILTGGGAHLKNMAAYLEEIMEIKTIIGNPWDKIAYPEGLKKEIAKIDSEMSVAIGLAIKNK